MRCTFAVQARRGNSQGKPDAPLQNLLTRWSSGFGKMLYEMDESWVLGPHIALQSKAIGAIV